MTAIRFLPVILEIIRKANVAFASEGVQELFAAIGRIIDRTAPPAPQQDCTGIFIGDTEKYTQRRRLFQFRNRVGAACILTDEEVQEICDQRNTQPQQPS